MSKLTQPAIMKHIIITIALAAAAAAHAGTITNSEGYSWTSLPGTARTYRNVNGTIQYDMLFAARDEKGKLDQRVRLGVTGCDKDQGLFAEVDHQGKPVLSKPKEWVRGGPAAMDGLAALICDEAMMKGDSL